MSRAWTREVCSWECNEFAVPPVCLVCNDIRFVCTKSSARRHTTQGSASEVFPCPACGKYVLDGDGKKYGTPGRRYGNPLIQSDDDYGRWKARNREKAKEWQDSTLFESEKANAKHLQSTYIAADPRWVRLWVLGERKVQP